MSEDPVGRLRNAIARAVLLFVDGGESPAVVRPLELPFSNMTEEHWRTAVLLWRQAAPGLLDAVAARSCPACGSDHRRRLFQSYDGHDFYECLDCGCWFVPKYVDSAVFDRFFGANEPARQLAESMITWRDEPAQRDADLRRIGGYLDELLELIPDRARPIHYLDSGCGVGHSLRAGLDRGLIVRGIEVDAAAIATARAAGLPVSTPGGDIGGPYELMTFWETLEHIANPLDVLTLCSAHLAATGLVAITVPNLNAFETRVLREKCYWVHGGYNTPGHINLFHAPAIARLLDRAGLHLLDVDADYSGSPVALAAGLSGVARGAFDLLDTSAVAPVISERLSGLLDAVWPAVSLAERVSLAAPILKVIACKKGAEAQFRDVIARRVEQRLARIRAQAAAMIAEETDYAALAALTQREVDRRDREIVVQAEQSAEAVRHRDSLLQELQDTANRLQRDLADAQAQINLRDDLLAGVRAELDRTIERRVRRVARRAGLKVNR